MKSALPAAVLLLIGLAGGWWLSGRGDAAAIAELLAVRDTLVLERATHRTQDSLLAAALAANDLRRAEDDRRVVTRRTTAVRLGATVAPLLDSARVLAGACTDSSGIDSVLAAADAAMAAHLVADSLARAAEDQRHAGDSTWTDWLQTSAIPALQADRDTAQARAERAVQLGLRRRPTPRWQKVLTATSCAIAGAAAVTNNAAVGIPSGGACVASIVF